MSELLPCPFCGEKPVHIQPENADHCDYIRCDKCGFDMEGEYTWDGILKTTCKTLWNTRADVWLPIESAPKAESILIFDDSEKRQFVGYVDDVGDVWADIHGEDDTICCVPTHWMPLPKPPREIFCKRIERKE